MLRTAITSVAVVAFACVAFYLGMIVPKSLVESGVNDFEGEKRKIARTFYSYEMWRKYGEGPEAYILTGARVTEIERCLGSSPYNPRSTLPYGAEITGTIWAHTVFGLPYRKIEATCGQAAAG